MGIVTMTAPNGDTKTAAAIATTMTTGATKAIAMIGTTVTKAIAMAGIVVTTITIMATITTTTAITIITTTVEISAGRPASPNALAGLVC